MVIPRALFSRFLLAILVLMEPGEVRCYDLNKLEIHDDLLPFTQGLGFDSIANVPTGGLQDGLDDVVQAWYLDDDSKEDIRLPHRRQHEDHVPLTRLLDLGIMALRLDAENYEHDENLTITRDQLPMDILDLTPDQPMLKLFFPEHLHTHDELRFCLEGSGYFDVRDQDDRWVRVSVKKGALIVVPAGIYHRFTLDTNNYFKVMRVFLGGHWKPYYRPHDHIPARKRYLAKLH